MSLDIDVRTQNRHYYALMCPTGTNNPKRIEKSNYVRIASLVKLGLLLTDLFKDLEFEYVMIRSIAIRGQQFQCYK